MRTVRVLALLLISAVALLACGSSKILPSDVIFGDKLISARTAYVVKPDRFSRDIEVFIQSALAKRGIAASCGPIESKPQNVDIYVTFMNSSAWDLAVYLVSLDISFFDNNSNRLIAHGRFQNGKKHTFPNVKDTVNKV